MLIFGPANAIPTDKEFCIFNLTSSTQSVPRLAGLVVNPGNIYIDGEAEKSFDIWYYEYILNDMTACTSLMSVLDALYMNNNVYICISEYINDPFMSIINETFMKILQTRYGIKYSIINDPDDYNYIPKDGCDFMSVNGIMNFDKDRRRYQQLYLESTV